MPFTYIVTFKAENFFGDGAVRRFNFYGKSAVFIICALCYIRELYINRESMFSLFTRYIEKAEPVVSAVAVGTTTFLDLAPK